MSYCGLLGTGTMAKGADEPFSHGLSSLERMPIHAYVDPRVGRRFGRLTRMVFIAAHRALADAGDVKPDDAAIVVATAIGDTRAALGIMADLKESGGVLLSPGFVPNSNHHAPAGHLSIGLCNRQPTITVNQGRLSAEAGLSAALDMMGAGLCDRVIAAAGDEAEPSWADRLREAGDAASAERLEAEAFEEGAAALLLSACAGHPERGRLSAGVERWDGTPEGLRRFLARRQVRVTEKTEIRVRKIANGAALLPVVSEALSRPKARIAFDGPGPGTSQTGPFLHVVEAARSGRDTDLLLFGADIDEVGFVHWTRAS